VPDTASNVTERLDKPAACLGTPGQAAGLGTRRYRQSRTAAAQSCRRLERRAPGVAASILKGLDEMLTVNRLGLPTKLRRSLACTNSIEKMMGTVRRVCRNVKRWRYAAMALRWTAAGMVEAAKGFRRLKPTSSRLFSELRSPRINPNMSPSELKITLMTHGIIHGNAYIAYFNKIWGIPFWGALC
jgi:hypothetical protein